VTLDPYEAWDQDPLMSDDKRDEFDRKVREAAARIGPPQLQSESDRRRITNWVIAIGLLILGIPFCIGLLLPSVERVKEASTQVKSANNLKMIGLAIHNYHDNYGELPTNAYAPDGKPLLSWRVHLLPYVECEALYEQFDLDEPWDGPTNRKLLDKMPRLYANPKDFGRPLGNKTYYRGFSSPGAVFEKRPQAVPPRNKPWDCAVDLMPGARPDERFGFRKFKDPSGETIAVVEAGDAIEWTRPDDLDASPDKPLPPLGGLNWPRKRMNVLFVDGSVRPIRSDVPESTLRALVTHSGGEALPAGWDK
jgi:prepilin-type processing-associated H-X9-DG protein